MDASRQQRRGRGDLLRAPRLSPVVVVALLALAPCSPPGMAADGPTLRPTSELRPAFVLDELTGGATRLESYSGRIVLVHFFATWCEPCRDEFPKLDRLKVRSGDSVAVLAISVGEEDARVRNVMAGIPVTFPVLLDRDASVANAWKVKVLPTTIVLDRRLVARLAVAGATDWDGIDIEDAIAALDRPGRARTLVDQARNSETQRGRMR